MNRVNACLQKFEIDPKLNVFLREKIREKIETRNFLLFFKDLYFIASNNLLKIYCQNEEIAEIINNKFLSQINEIIKENWSDCKIIVKIFYHQDEKEIEFINKEEILIKENKIIYFDDRENEFLFENFISSESNLAALEICQSICCYNSKNLINSGSLIFLNGSSGSGKTHLLKAMYKFYTSENGKIFYSTSMNLLKKYVDSVKNNTSFVFQDEILKNEIILIDDIDPILSKTGTASMVCNIIKQALENKKFVIISSCKNIQDIIEINKVFESNLSMAIGISISKPDFELKKKIIIAEILKNNYKIPLSVADLVAKKFDQNIREIKSILRKLSIVQHIKKFELNPALALEIINENLKKSEILQLKNHIEVSNIIDKVAKFYNIPENGFLTSKIKSANVCKARNVAIYFCFHIKHMSYQEIGRAFGKKHSTIIASMKIIHFALENDRKLPGEIAEIKINILNK